MPLVNVQVVLAHDSALPEDNFVNVWHFDMLDPTSFLDRDSIRDALADFYGLAVGAGNAIRTYMSPEINPAATRFKFYDMTDVPPRVPLEDTQQDIGAVNAGTGLPAEVALCLSYQAVAVSGEDQARRRNRIYLGPWSQAAGSLQSGIFRPVQGLIDAIAAAAGRLKDISDAEADWKWMIHSAARGVALGGGAFGVGSIVSVDNGWVDNAWDTQRRRGKAASSRTLWS